MHPAMLQNVAAAVAAASQASAFLGMASQLAAVHTGDHALAGQLVGQLTAVAAASASTGVHSNIIGNNAMNHNTHNISTSSNHGHISVSGNHRHNPHALATATHNNGNNLLNSNACQPITAGGSAASSVGSTSGSGSSGSSGSTGSGNFGNNTLMNFSYNVANLHNSNVNLFNEHNNVRHNLQQNLQSQSQHLNDNNHSNHNLHSIHHSGANSAMAMVRNDHQLLGNHTGVSGASANNMLNSAYQNSHANNGNNQLSSIINNSQPDQAIGYGAFGVVWAVTDPRDGKRVALKKMPNVFQNLVSSKRVYREIKMLCFFKHENIISALDILQPPDIDFFQEIYVITELMHSDLHKIIISPQPLTPDHVKVFLYQILRGLKYLHSANILHRDIKPGNLLVNANCLLKICDFGLARVMEPDESKHMTQEVVTQYYRAPELLMGTKHYGPSVDMWSIGCIFAELLGRRILFQARTPIQQLEMITELLGTPSLEDMQYACEPAKAHMLRRPQKPCSLTALYSLSNHANHEAVHLLCQMLVFNPDKRISCVNALAHPYLEEGCLRFHTCMCNCCMYVQGVRRYCSDLEPVATRPFDDSFEKDLYNVQQVKERLHKRILEKCNSWNRVPLCINPHSAAFKTFTNSTVAHPAELPLSPHQWE